jgi:hypothetical protein
MLMAPPTSSIVLALCLGVLLAGLGTVLYRLTLHPLSSFRGPALAAASGLFIFYYDVIKDGKLHLKLEELHEQYGIFTRFAALKTFLLPPSLPQ